MIPSIHWTRTVASYERHRVPRAYLLALDRASVADVLLRVKIKTLRAIRTTP